MINLNSKLTKIGKTIFLCTSLVSFMGPFGSAYASDVFKPFEGSWKGSGKVKQSSSSKANAIICKTEATLKKDGHQLVSKGKCSIANGSARVSLNIKYDPNKKKFSGDMVAGGWDFFISNGVKKGNTITLTVKRYKQSTNTYDTMKTVLTSGNSSYKMAVSAQDKSTNSMYEMAHIKFNKK